ncbi:ubiquitin carrier protein 7 [Zea mays]|uniref:Ubiquitin carrier protein 7 n=1 Tax=Zea mays TaxID=4577 RepID=A0A1D6EQM3_MAIZE|nr:ubiquitin carrier protein 7 [Zea mays]
MNEHQERVREEAYTVGTCPSQWRCSGDGGDRHWHGEAAKPTAAEPHLEEEVENLCRYELPNESWEVNLPPEKEPEEFSLRRSLLRPKERGHIHVDARRLEPEEDWARRRARRTTSPHTSPPGRRR